MMTGTASRGASSLSKSQPQAMASAAIDSLLMIVELSRWFRSVDRRRPTRRGAAPEDARSPWPGRRGTSAPHRVARRGARAETAHDDVRSDACLLRWWPARADRLGSSRTHRIVRGIAARRRDPGCRTEGGERRRRRLHRDAAVLEAVPPVRPAVDGGGQREVRVVELDGLDVVVVLVHLDAN